MTDQMVMEIGRNAMTVTLMMAGPILGVALAVGLAISVFQAVTQINESTLTFVPKILAMFAILAVIGPWMIQTIMSYTTSLFAYLPYMTR